MSGEASYLASTFHDDDDDDDDLVVPPTESKH